MTARRIPVLAERLAEDAPLSEWKNAVAALSEQLGWTKPGGRPFSAVVTPESRVLVKPNWVMHQNKGPWGLEPLVTDPRLIMAVCELILDNGPALLTLGDAPLQSCDVDALWSACGLLEWAQRIRAAGAPLAGPADFRRTVSRERGGVLVQEENVQSAERYRLVNIGADSLLEPITTGGNSFRVTQYDPDLMKERHRRGHHEYLVASDVLEATLVVNLPKLKTHKKAGLTAALKNLVGINGNKEFLPHHRIGSPREGGDCYPNSSWVRRVQERMYDGQNRSRSPRIRRAYRLPLGALSRVAQYDGLRTGLEGAWHGNDTVWRMALDLNRVLLYATRDGAMTDTRQRRELHIIDAVVAGQGDGPLAPERFELGLVLGSDDAVAADSCAARLLGYDPGRIPIVREAFGQFRYPLTDIRPEQAVLTDRSGAEVAPGTFPKPTRYPEGWLEAIDRGRRPVAPIGFTYNGRRDRRRTENSRPLVMHVISGLSTGGAQSMLAELVAKLDGGRTDHEVVSMTTVGPVGVQMRATGTRVHALGMSRGIPDPRGVWRFLELLRHRQPAVIQTWMYHADLFGGVIAKCAGRRPVVWGIRQSDVRAENGLAKLLSRVINPPLSYLIPTAIVSCGDEARRVHLRSGYRLDQFLVIPNGFDLSRYRIDVDAAARFRRAYRIAEDSPLVGIAGRLHPMKDHQNFFRAAGLVARRHPSARFVLCGEGLTAETADVQRWMLEAGLRPEQILLLGRIDRMEEVYPALTVAVLSSCSGEGFPNVLAEAMACGVPCVTTDVGDASAIVGNTGRVVPPADPGALAAGIVEVLDMPSTSRRALGCAARARIDDSYSIAAIAARYEELYLSVMHQN